MTEQLANLHRLFESFPLRPIHTSPLIHKANDYYHWSYEDRRYLFNRMFAFIRNCRHAWPRPRLRVFRVILYYIFKPNARKKRDAAKAASRLHAGILI